VLRPPGTTLCTDLGSYTAQIWRCDGFIVLVLWDTGANARPGRRHLVQFPGPINFNRYKAWSVGFGSLVCRQATSRPLDLCVGSAMILSVHLGDGCRVFHDVVSDLTARYARCGPLVTGSEGIEPQRHQQQRNSAPRALKLGRGLPRRPDFE